MEEKALLKFKFMKKKSILMDLKWSNLNLKIKEVFIGFLNYKNKKHDNLYNSHYINNTIFNKYEFGMTTKTLEQPSPFDTDGTYLYKIGEYLDIPIKYIFLYLEIQP